MPFPEAGTHQKVGDYEHFRPFLSGGSLHYSYGILRSSPAWIWYQNIANLPPARMIAQLEATGFSALWIDRRGFPDGARDLLAKLKILGYSELIQVANLPIVVVKLQPAEIVVSANTRDPTLYPAWHTGKVPASDSQGPSLRAIGGWYPLEHDDSRQWRWVARRARLGVRLPSDASAPQAITFNVASLRPGTLRVWHGDTLLWSAPITRQPQSHRIELPSKRPLRNLRWVFEGPVVYPPNNDRRRLGFRVENLKLVSP